MKEADENFFIDKLKRAVEDLKWTIEYKEGRLLPQVRTSVQVMSRLKVNLICWNKCTALESDHCILDDEGHIYPEKVLHSASDLRRDERNKLGKHYF